METQPRPFGKYFLLQKIATGGMAEIYTAKTFGSDGFEKVVVIKKILAHWASDPDCPDAHRRGEAFGAFNHAVIVGVFDLEWKRPLHQWNTSRADLKTLMNAARRRENHTPDAAASSP
jgi:hypothetical protein